MSIKEKVKEIRKNMPLYALALAIPLLLCFDSFQSHRYSELQKEVKKLESVESSLIENNKNLVAEISLLSSAERIESFAINELGMRKAGSDEIVRVEVKK